MSLPIPPNCTVVITKARFVGFHRWPEAPDEVAFLRDLHRHEFHVEVSLETKHDNRELEFFTVKNWLLENPLKDLNLIRHDGTDKRTNWSCEQMAEYIGNKLREEYGSRWMQVGVYEDGENGGVAIWDR